MRLLAALLLTLPAAALAQAPIVGIPIIIDGDSLRFPAVKVRLNGIDAPELQQTCGDPGREWPCGRVAAEALRALIAGRPVECRLKELDRYGRSVSECTVGGESVNAWMVLQGHAVAFRRYDMRYVPHEDLARQALRGLWSGSFTAPWEWRAQRSGR